jgi:biopolymer transport protein ExbD
MQNVNIPKLEVSIDNIEVVLLNAREVALKEMAKKLPHLEESEAIKQIIASAELDPNGPVAKRFAEYISLALTTFF